MARALGAVSSKASSASASAAVGRPRKVPRRARVELGSPAVDDAQGGLCGAVGEGRGRGRVAREGHKHTTVGGDTQAIRGEKRAAKPGGAPATASSSNAQACGGVPGEATPEYRGPSRESMLWIFHRIRGARGEHCPRRNGARLAANSLSSLMPRWTLLTWRCRRPGRGRVSPGAGEEVTPRRERRSGQTPRGEQTGEGDERGGVRGQGACKEESLDTRHKQVTRTQRREQAEHVDALLGGGEGRGKIPIRRKDDAHAAEAPGV